MKHTHNLAQALISFRSQLAAHPQSKEVHSSAGRCWFLSPRYPMIKEAFCHHQTQLSPARPPPFCSTYRILLTCFNLKEVNAAILCHWEISTSHPARHLLVSLRFDSRSVASYWPLSICSSKIWNQLIIIHCISWPARTRHHDELWIWFYSYSTYPNLPHSSCVRH